MKIKKFIYSNFEIMILISLFIFVKSFFLFKFHELIWDESVYLAAGKYLYSSGTVGLWEMVRPPILPIFTGLFWKMGINSVLASELLSLLFSSALIYVNYILSREFFDRKYSLLSSFLLAITPVFFLYSSYILTEIPATLFLLISIYFFLFKKNYFVSGIFCSISILTKFTQLLAVPIFLILILINFKKLKNTINHLILFLVGFVIPAIPFLLFNLFLYRDYTSNIFVAALRPFILAFSHQSNVNQILSENLFNILFYVHYFFNNFSVQFMFILGVLIFVAKKKFKEFNYLSLFIFFTVFLSYFTYIINKQDRFVILILPFITFFTVFAFQQTIDFFYKNKKFNKLLIFAMVVILLLVFIKPVISQDKEYYALRYSEPSQIVEEFYTFFNKNNVEGAVLTSDPTSAGYVDKLFIPYYFVLKDRPETYNEFDSNKKIGAIIYVPKSFSACSPEDSVCSETKMEFFKYLKQNGKEIFHKQYFCDEYYIFKVE